MVPPDDPVDLLLDRLRGATPTPLGSVRGDVWRRIANSEYHEARPSLAERLELAFARPAFAIAFIVACVLGGLLLAEMRASQIRIQQRLQVELHYLQLVDPLLVDPLIDGLSAGPSSALSR